jgi:hypothetical protein
VTNKTPTPRDDRELNAGERRELREAVLTFAPTILVAFVLRWALVTNAGWTSRRALVWSVGVGIVLALLLQRAVRRRP